MDRRNESHRRARASSLDMVAPKRSGSRSLGLWLSASLSSGNLARRGFRYIVADGCESESTTQMLGQWHAYIALGTMLSAALALLVSYMP